MLKSASSTLLQRKDHRPADTLPELYVYEDNGCEVSSSCLNCPLPRCKYDDPAWFQRYRRLSKDLVVLAAMERDGLTVEETAERFSVTARTVFRAIRRCRDAMSEMSQEGEALPALAA
ncbi:MAG: hypothetical protein FJ316_07760 [SAR202 cluster bacterium]|nr:hypothetical protein [SAR202 cluster bacterium]